MKAWTITAMLIMAIFLATNVSAYLYFYELEPPNGFSVDVGSLLNISSSITDTVSDVNGTFCIGWELNSFGNGGYHLCNFFEEQGIAGIDLTINVSLGTKYWRANWTNYSDSYFLDSGIRSYIGIYSDRTLLPIYPINNETVTGDSTDFIVNYTVDMYLPYDITYPLSIRFYGYSSYLSNPLSSSERLICAKIVNANSTNPLKSGLHRIGCENYMYEAYYINYEELPNYKFWKAKLRVIDGEVDGHNLLSDTGYQDYRYAISTNFASVFPLDDEVYCDSTLFIWNRTWYNIENLCWEGESYGGDFIGFYSYLRDGGCGTGNLTFRYRNNANSSQTGSAEINLVPNGTEDYFEADLSFPSINPSNETYFASGVNLTAVHYIYNWTYYCGNGSVYTTSDKDLYYIIGIGGSQAQNVTSGYPAYPLCQINMTALMPSFADEWGYFFGQNTEIGLALLALFFLTAMGILLLMKSDVIGAGGVVIYGVLVFSRICYLPIWVAWAMLVISGLVFVHIIRKVILGRR